MLGGYKEGKTATAEVYRKKKFLVTMAIIKFFKVNTIPKRFRYKSILVLVIFEKRQTRYEITTREKKRKKSFNCLILCFA